MGDFPGHLALGNVVGHAAQVFKQHHAQGGRQGPELAQPQFAVFLVGVEKGGEQFRVEHAVGMGHVSPGDAVDAWQAFQRRRCQLGQARVITPRHTFADLLQLGFDEVKVVEQPFGGRCYVVAAARGQRHIVIGLAQRDQVFLDTWKKGSAAPRRAVGLHRLGLGQTAAMLFEAVYAEQLGAYGRLGFRPLRQEDLACVRGE